MSVLRRWWIYAFRPAANGRAFADQSGSAATSHGRRSRNLDYARVAKVGFPVGLGLFAAGAVGKLVEHTLIEVRVADALHAEEHALVPGDMPGS